MLPSFASPRPKSTPNVIVKDIEAKKIQSLSEEQRFRTYNVKDMKLARAYLPIELIREFKQGFEASAKSPSTPKSRNFVRKLVATLENKKEQGSGHCTADEEFFTCYARTPVKKAPIPPKKEEKTEDFDEFYGVNIKNLSQSIIDDDNDDNDDNVEKEKSLDDVIQKNELKADEFRKICLSKNCDSNSNYIFQENVDHMHPTKHLPYITEEDTEKDDSHESQAGDFFRFRSVESINFPEIVHAEQKNKRSTFRRTAPVEEKRSFKSVLSSLMGFRNRKSVLPKGKRNVLSPKESLGEEMRLFRKDLMPALLKAAQPYNASDVLSEDETFASIMAACRPKYQSSDRSASIRPFYRGKKSASPFTQTPKGDNSEPQVGSSKGENYSKSQDVEKVILREKNTRLYERPPAIIYDVPRSNKIVRPGLELRQNRESIRTYENSAIVDVINRNRSPNLLPRIQIVTEKRALYTNQETQL